MDFDKKTIIGMLLIGLVIIFTNTDLYQRFAFNKTSTPSEKVYDSSTPFVQDSNSASQTLPQAETAPDPIISSTKNKSQMLLENMVEDFGLQIQNNEEKLIRVETSKFIAEISTIGPRIVSWKLKDYLGVDSNYVNLFDGEGGHLSVGFPVQGDTLSLENFSFHTDADTQNLLSASGDSLTIPFTLSIGEGKKIVQNFIFVNDRYDFDITIHSTGLENLIDGYSYILKYNGWHASTESDVVEDMSRTVAFAMAQDEIEEFDVGTDISAINIINDWHINWASIRTKYFTSVIIPRTSTSNGIGFSGKTKFQADDVVDKQYDLQLRLPYSRKPIDDRFTVYVGPLDYYMLKSYDLGLEEMMSLGPRFIIRPLSKLILLTITWLHTFIANYGLVIVIFTVIVKIVLNPLTKKSYKSMKAMQQLQPKMKEIQEKYKGDSAKTNAAMMQLYKDHGANPAGGCLPMLLQLPLFYALFEIFRTTIEFRGAPFIGWITDLSGPDTVFILPFEIPFYGTSVNALPLIMGITMVLQQQQTIADPKQKIMIYMMPVMMIIFFNTFPSGLTLYYSLFNILTIIQQKFIPHQELDASQKEALKKKKYTGRKKMSRIDIMRQQMKKRR